MTIDVVGEVRPELEELCRDAPEAMAACFDALSEAPYPDEWVGLRHGPIKDARSILGPEGAWEWRVSDVLRVIYKRGPGGPVIVYVGQPV
jgi:hypothetical protein